MEDFLNIGQNSLQVSVIMIAHNEENYIERSIKSILNQSYSAFELIIVNDGSNDTTLSIIEKYKQKDHRIIIFSNNKRLGPSYSRNKALKLARGKYIAFLDADDMASKDRLQIQLRYMKNFPQVFLTCTGFYRINSSGSKLSIYYSAKRELDIRKELIQRSTGILLSTVMMRNSREFFFDSKFDGAEDYEVFLKVILAKKKILGIQKLLGYYRVTDKSASYNKACRLVQRKKVREIQEQYLNQSEFELNKTSKRDEDFFEIDRLYNLRKKKELRQEIKRHLNDDKGFNGIIIYYFMSFLPNSVLFVISVIRANIKRFF